MQKEKLAERTATNMRGAARALSEMAAHSAHELRRLQKQQEKALGRKVETAAELAAIYDSKSIRELTAVLKDIAAVAKALEERPSGEESAVTGVVLLPPIAPDETAEREAREIES